MFAKQSNRLQQIVFYGAAALPVAFCVSQICAIEQNVLVRDCTGRESLLVLLSNYKKGRLNQENGVHYVRCDYNIDYSNYDLIIHYVDDLLDRDLLAIADYVFVSIEPFMYSFPQFTYMAELIDSSYASNIFVVYSGARKSVFGQRLELYIKSSEMINKVCNLVFSEDYDIDTCKRNLMPFYEHSLYIDVSSRSFDLFCTIGYIWKPLAKRTILANDEIVNRNRWVL